MIRETVVNSSAARAEPKQTGDCDVLVVDDNPHVNKALAVLLRSAGFVPIPCHRGGDALTHIQQPGAPAPCAAVIDIHLPDISGLIVAQKLRSRFGATIPIIVVSGDTSMETIKALSHIGATYFFSKPISAAALVEQLKTLTGGRNDKVTR